MLSLVRSLGPLPGCFFFFNWVLGLSHPWLYDADNRVTNKIGKGYCACFQCETTKGNEEGTGNRARGPQLFFFWFSKSKLKQDRSQLQGRKSQAEIGYAKFAKFASIFFPNKERLEFLGQASRRREQNWQTSRTTNGEARKYLLGKWQKRLQSASGYLNNPYKNSQTAPTTTHGRSNQQASAEMTPLRPQGVPNHCQLQCLLSRYALSQRATDPILLQFDGSCHSHSKAGGGGVAALRTTLFSRIGAIILLFLIARIISLRKHMHVETLCHQLCLYAKYSHAFKKILIQGDIFPLIDYMNYKGRIRRIQIAQIMEKCQLLYLRSNFPILSNLKTFQENATV